MPQWDLANSDCVLVMGSNMAEAHPIAFRFVLQAKERGATVIHVDPRFTRTSALSDIHAPIRAGSDIAFLGGIIRQLLENALWFRDYALSYTNLRSEEHTSELQSLMRISYAFFCLKQTTQPSTNTHNITHIMLYQINLQHNNHYT